MHSHHEPHIPLPDPAIVGQWEMLDAQFEGAATHVALLPTNKIFAYGGSSLDQSLLDSPPPAELLDLATWRTAKVAMHGVAADIWCGGHTFLADGRLLFAGGTDYYPRGISPFYGGHRQAYTFDPFAKDESESWQRLPDMLCGRWYPTLIRLPDDTVLAVAGTRDRFPELWQRLQEIYQPGRGWQPLPDKQLFPLYPRLHLLPDGRVFYSGIFNTHYQIPWAFPSAILDQPGQRWRPLGGKHQFPEREEGISLLLALRPPDYKAEVLVAGGGRHNKYRFVVSLLAALGLDAVASSLHHNRAMDSVERIDLSRPQPLWELDSRMHYPRIHAVGVLLPDGQVAVIGGMSHHSGHTHQLPQEGGVGTALATVARLNAELYDPGTRTWQAMAPQARARVYHSTALLLPDGRVISMGSNPYAKVIEHTIEIFSPPYLFHGDRPVITDRPATITYGQPFRLGLDRARQVGQVVFMRPEVLTHVTNSDQRLVELPFVAVAGDRLEVAGPPNRQLMPPGYYLLFAVNLDGVPSIGHFVRLMGQGR